MLKDHARIAVVCLAIVALHLRAVSAAAGEPPVLPPPAPVGPAANNPLPASLPTPLPTTMATPGAASQPGLDIDNVATQSEQVVVDDRVISNTITADHVPDQMNDELSNLAVELDARQEETGKLLAAAPTLQTLDQMQRDWREIAVTLTQWKASLGERQKRLGEQARTLGNEEQTWNSIAALDQQWSNAHKQGGPTLLTPSVRAARAAIARAKHDVDDRLNLVNPLALRVDAQLARVREVLASVDQSRDDAFGRLLDRDSPPIWMPSAWRSAGGPNVLQQGQTSLASQFRALAAYVRRERERLALHAVLLVVLAVLLLRVRRNVVRWAKDDAALVRAMPAYQSPVATAIVASFLVGIWIYPQAPRLFWAIFGATALVPTVLIARDLLEKHLYSLLNAAVVFYFLDQLRSVVASIPILARLLFLLEAGSACALLLSFLRSTRVLGDTLRRAWLLRIAARGTLAVLAVAFVTGVIGNVSFSTLLGDATFGSAYLAVILYAATRIADGISLTALRSRPLTLLTAVRDHAQLVFRRISEVIRTGSSALWGYFTLQLFCVWPLAVHAAHQVWDSALQVGQFSVTTGNLLEFVVTVWASFLVSRFARFILCEDVFTRFALQGGMSYAIEKMVHYAILLVGAAVALSAMGYDMSKLTILASAFTLGIGFGLQNIVNNFVSGLILLFERPVKVGDSVEVDTVEGVIRHIGIRASIIMTPESSEVIVPNGRLISDKVTNWTLSNRERGIVLTMSAPATLDPERVLHILQTTAASSAHVAKRPAPAAVLKTFSGATFDYELRAWTDRPDAWLQVRSDLAIAINKALAGEMSNAAKAAAAAATPPVAS